MLSRFVAGLLDENWTLGIEVREGEGEELPNENIAGLLELKVAGRKTLPDFRIKPDKKYDQIFGIELRYSNSTAGALEHLDACESMVILEFIFEQENLKVLKISLNMTDSLLSLDMDFDSFSTFWTWEFDGLFFSSLDVKFGENIPLTRRFVFQVFR
ncbi:hypothetical protein RhiirB3_446152 [Rhizophagus irregularis]|nr:hypothetical protein RhiirB3_446152 [Rhizophagus irregularis]